MKTYRVQCTWMMWGEMVVEATSEKEAIKKAHDNDSLPDGSYVGDSFEVVDVEETVRFAPGERYGPGQRALK